MKKIKALCLMMLVVLTSGIVSSCGNNEPELTVPDVVEYSNDNYATTLKFKDRFIAEYQVDSIAKKLTQDEVNIYNTLRNYVIAARTAANEYKPNKTDLDVMNTFNLYTLQFQSGYGFEGFIRVTKTVNGGSPIEIGKVTFTK